MNTQEASHSMSRMRSHESKPRTRLKDGFRFIHIYNNTTTTTTKPFVPSILGWLHEPKRITPDRAHGSSLGLFTNEI